VSRGLQNVLRSVCEFLSKLLPPSAEDESSQNLVRDLFSIAETMVKASKGRLDADPLFQFLRDFVATYGKVIEQGAVASARESIIPEDARALGCMFEELLLCTLAAFRNNLGNAWGTSKEQGNGQPPFESKPLPAQKSNGISNESLAGVLALAEICMDSCPVFIFQFPSTPGLEAEDHMFLRRAIDSAVASLNDCDPSIAANSMRFLKSVFSSCKSMMNGTKLLSDQQQLCTFLSKSTSRTRSDVIQRLLLGSCGKMNRSLIGEGAELLVTILQGADVNDSESAIISALNREVFFLGDSAMDMALSIFRRAARRLVQSKDLAIFLEDVWDLHQVENADALPGSEAVARFLRKHDTFNH